MFRARSHCLPDDTLKSVLEPLHRLGMVDPVRGSDLRLTSPTLRHAFTGTGPVLHISLVI